MSEKKTPPAPRPAPAPAPAPAPVRRDISDSNFSDRGVKADVVTFFSPPPSPPVPPKGGK